jgi:transposase
METIMAVAITRQDVSVDDLRREAGRTRDAKAARRMLAVALVMEGQSREAAAECCGMDRQTLRDWVHRFNADGLAGLSDLPRQNGPKPRLSPEQEAVVAGWVEQGPDLARDGVVRWRCVDLQERIKREWGIGLHERTVGKLLRRLAFRRLSVRPQHPNSDPAAQAVFRTGSRAL